MDLTAFAAEVGDATAGAVTIAGSSTRGGAVAGVRCVHAPAGIDWIQADEMTVSCGAGTSVADLGDALAAVGQRIALPMGGTVGGALSVGRSGVRRLGDGPVRDVLLQADTVSAAGRVVTAGGPTVKNVTGFDLCRLLVGAHGTLAFIGSVILRTQPLAPSSGWYRTATDPWETLAALYRPVSVLWDGAETWALLEGHPADVAAQAAQLQMTPVDGHPMLPTAARRSVAPRDVAELGRALSAAGDAFVAEIGVGVVHTTGAPATAVAPSSAVVRLHQRLKDQFDPTHRLNPGVDPLALQPKAPATSS